MNEMNATNVVTTRILDLENTKSIRRPNKLDGQKSLPSVFSHQLSSVENTLNTNSLYVDEPVDQFLFSQLNNDDGIFCAY